MLLQVISGYRLEFVFPIPMCSRFSFSTWNINGLSSKSFGDKLLNRDFLTTVDHCDFVILTEIWSRSKLDISGFKSFTSLSNQKTFPGRKSGGISFLFKDKFENHISMIQSSNNFLWCKLSKEIWRYSKDVYACGVYIPPQNSPHFHSEIFEQLSLDLTYYQAKGHVILLGDFNAPTGTYPDSVSKAGNNLIENDRSEVSLNLSMRHSFDGNINSHGKQLLEVCKHFDLRILNGRTNGDTLGRPTYHGKNGTSVVNYIICHQDLFYEIDHFIVKQPSYLSDHSQLVGWLEPRVGNSLQSNPNEQLSSNNLTKLPPQFIWEKDLNLKFSSSLKSQNIQMLIADFLNRDFTETKEGLKESVNRAEQIFLEAAKCSLKLKSTKSKTKMSRTTPKKWFDKDCNMKRIAMRRLSNQKHRDPLNVSSRESYHKALKEYKQLLASKQKAFHDNKIQQPQEIPGSSNSEHFWHTLKSMNDDITVKKVPPISKDQWLHHFESLHSATMNNSKQQKIVSDLKAMEQSENDLTALNGPITEREIQDTITKLKNNKATFSDKIKNEMIKAGLSSLMPIYKKLFNLVLNSGSFPDSWCQGLITPIFKSGKKDDPSNYRGICVASCLGKLFCSVLNHQLRKRKETPTSLPNWLPAWPPYC